MSQKLLGTISTILAVIAGIISVIDLSWKCIGLNFCFILLAVGFGVDGIVRLLQTNGQLPEYMED